MSSPTTTPAWHTDVLGDGWSALTLELPPDRFGPAVATLVRRTGQTHAQINSELNRLSGVGRITEATVGQLRKRLEVAEQLARR